MNHADRLRQWLRSASPDPEVLRGLLGEVLKEVNDASAIFKKGARNPTAETVQRAGAILADLQAYESLRALFPEVEEKARHLPGGAAITHILHTLEQARLDPHEVDELKRISVSDANQIGQEFPDEADQEGLDNHLKNSLYNAKNPADKTLRSVREILQNSVDATDPNQHGGVFARRRLPAQPEVRLSTHTWPNSQYMDIIVHDNGIGMDWATLSKKFYVIFQSGKKDEPGAAGGFGIAKGLFQQEPQHGWSVDTKHENQPQAVHSSRFHKNVYFGSRQGAYRPRTSTLKKDPEGGTVLSLYGLPVADDFRLENLCAVYAINGNVKIYLNDRLVAPRFTLQSPDVKPVSGIADVAGVLAADEPQKDNLVNSAGTFGKRLTEKLTELSFALGAKQETSVKFFVRKTDSYYGKLYVTLNGQYQFDKDIYANKVDVICVIQTTARPGSPTYPVDAGRENVRGKENDLINAVVNTIKEFTDKAGDDDLFKQGIDSIMMNNDAEPMSTREEDDDAGKQAHLAAAVGVDLRQTMSRTPEDQVATIERAVQDAGGAMSSIQKVVVSALVQNQDQRIEEKERIKDIIEGLSTPANVMVQKNFVARDLITRQENLKHVAEMVILWQKTLKILTRQLASHSTYSLSRRQFIPGIIYSDEVLGIYVPPNKDSNRKFATVGLNAITLAATTSPQTFHHKLGRHSGKDAFQTVEDPAAAEESPQEKSRGGSAADTPVNRVTKLLFHIGVHELCHLFYPDSYGNENFHKNITYMEMYCHDGFQEIKNEVKRYMKGLRRSSISLISLIARSKKRLGESFGVWLDTLRPVLVEQYRYPWEEDRPYRLGRKDRFARYVAKRRR